MSPARAPDPFEFTPEMQRAARQVAGKLPPSAKLERLQRFLFDNISFEYHAEETVPAATDFERKRGNCVAFTAMFIAMARSVNCARRVDGRMISEDVAVFFYGLFMNESLLVSRGIHPSKAAVGYVEGYALRIGRRATLRDS